MAAAALWAAACLLPGARAQLDRPAGWQFGVIGGADYRDEATDLGAGWQQIAFEWAAFQPGGPDDFVAEAVDPGWLRAALSDGREVVGLITATPAWASASGDPAAVPAGLDLPIDDPDNVWAAFVSQLVAEFTPRGVWHWVIYDEPDVRLGEGDLQFAGEVDDYARMVEVAYRAAREAHPQARVHLAAMNWWVDVAAGREPYLARLVPVLIRDGAADGAPPFDGITVRVVNSTAAVWNILTAVRQVLEAHGLDDVPIWLEMNASPTLDEGDPAAPPAFGITPAKQADFVVQAAALGLAAGVERVAVARWVDQDANSEPWGLVRADGSRRPAFDAYRMVIDLFGPTQTADRYENMFAELVVLEQAGRSVYAMWARGSNPVEFIITSAAVGERAALFTPTGEERALISEALEWPAAFTVSAPSAGRDANGFLTVAGSPSIAVFDAGDDFFRVVYVVVNGERYRLK
jgi:hypothetical protein